MGEAVLIHGPPRRASLRPRVAGAAPILLLLLALALVPPIATALDQPFLIRVFTRVVVFALAAVALNLVVGFGGLVCLLHAGLFGMGGYVVAILAHHDFSAEPLFGILDGSSDLALSIPLAVFLVGVTAAATGLVALRTSGAYFIMMTLAFNQMLYYFFVALQQYGGEDGLQILSNLHFLGVDIIRRVPFYYICLGILGAVLVFLARMVESRFGMVLRAAAQNERRLVALGIPALRYKLTAFVISGIIAGLAGALWSAGQQFISPADMSWIRSGDLVVMAVLGGLATVWGPVLGAVAFLILEALFSDWTMYWQLPLGLLIILTATLLRGGLSDVWRLVLTAARDPRA
jgi:branched-chain amino acid transport system permease protein